MQTPAAVDPLAEEKSSVRPEKATFNPAGKWLMDRSRTVLVLPFAGVTGTVTANTVPSAGTVMAGIVPNVKPDWPDWAEEGMVNVRGMVCVSPPPVPVR